MPFFSAVYVSTATVPFWDEEVAELLSTSRSNNARLGLTGMLLFKGGQFMQALEGEEREVRRLIASISDDPRHTDIRIVAEEFIEERQFPGWSMAYRGLTDETLRRIPGFSEYLDDPAQGPSLWANESRARGLLQWFKTNRI